MNEKYAFIDAHVHVYGHYSLRDLLDGATRNCALTYAANDTDPSTPLVLVLTETHGINFYEILSAAITKNQVPVPDYEFALLSESVTPLGSEQVGHSMIHVTSSLPVEPSFKAPIFIIPGKQIKAANGLEVSAIGLTQSIPDGGRLQSIVQKCIEFQAIPVLPWGVGKWFGRRGAEVQSCLDHFGTAVMISDNGNRPHIWPTPELITKNIGRHALLAGSDPLPIKGHEFQTARYGTYMSWDEKIPFTCSKVIDGIRDHSVRFSTPTGKRETLRAFIENQMKMQIYKRRKN